MLNFPFNTYQRIGLEGKKDKCCLSVINVPAIRIKELAEIRGFARFAAWSKTTL